MSGAEPNKYDMFDVARGTCTLEDFLLNRFTAQELEKKIQVDPQANFSEHIAPPKPPKPMFPTPGTPAKSMFPTPGTASAPPQASAPAEARPMEPNDIQKLIAGFYSAAQDYTKRAQWEEPPTSPGND